LVIPKLVRFAKIRAHGLDGIIIRRHLRAAFRRGPSNSRMARLARRNAALIAPYALKPNQV
jgi:hypothetical protein